jgi:hypothetical protein
MRGGAYKVQKKHASSGAFKDLLQPLNYYFPPPPACATGAVVARARWSILDKDTITIKAVTPISTSFDITTPL